MYKVEKERGRESKKRNWKEVQNVCVCKFDETYAL